MKHLTSTALALIMTIGLGACGAIDKIGQIGKAPRMSPLVTKETEASVRPVALPMPPQMSEKTEANSLWAANRATFFEDQRAGEIGDILTVIIEVDEEAKLENETSKSRNTTENAGIANLLGYEGLLDKVLPEGHVPGNLTGVTSNNSYAGNGESERKEEVSVRVAAIISQKLPNGNFIIHGRQELAVNFEKRVIQVDGVIRPEDISVDNTISYDQIAQARIAYGGEGDLTNVQQPRYGTQLYDIIFPF